MSAIPQSGWKPCSGCTCSNHQIPSYTFQEDISLLHFAHLTRSNDPPSPTEEEQLKEAISSYQQQIWDLDAEVSRLDVLLAYIQRPIQEKKEILHREKERVFTAIDDSQRIFSPVRRVPVEILAKIFHHTIEFPIYRSRNMSSHNGQWDSHFTGNPMWTIEAVLKQWRMVAMSFPELWSYINIVLTDLAEEWSPYLQETFQRTVQSIAKSSIIRIHRRRQRIPCHKVSRTMAGQIPFHYLPLHQRTRSFPPFKHIPPHQTLTTIFTLPGKSFTAFPRDKHV